VSVKLAENILERTSLDFLLKINKRCNYPNSLTDKEKTIISDGLSSGAPLTDERCSYNSMIEYVTIRKLQG
jgi:hypothetical protein